MSLIVLCRSEYPTSRLGWDTPCGEYRCLQYWLCCPWLLRGSQLPSPQCQGWMMVSATFEKEIMVAENGLPECSPPPNIPKIELINFFGRVGTVVGVKSLTPVCLTPGFFSLPGEALRPSFHLNGT